MPSSPGLLARGQKETVAFTADELDIAVRHLVRDLHVARPAVFWTDMLASAGLGWGAFGVAVTAPPLSPLMWVACLVAALALYRGLCFTHELTHLQRRVVPGFETVWNALLGVPLLLPSFTYLGVHQGHHNVSTYGTKEDPEYVPFANSHRRIVAFALQSLLCLPLMLLVRFLILAPVGLAWPRFHRWLEMYASSFALNPTYRRAVQAPMARKIRRWEVVILAAWSGLLTLMYSGTLPLRALPLWYVVLAFISFVNTLRVLGAHEYETDGIPRDRRGQLKDSIDTPGGPWTALWAPVGLRYHALHHYFPGIPYHNLGTAYRRIVQSLPDDFLYRESTSPSLPRSLTLLYTRARQARQRDRRPSIDTW